MSWCASLSTRAPSQETSKRDRCCWMRILRKSDIGAIPSTGLQGERDIHGGREYVIELKPLITQDV
jgi:hypothetical protein